MGKDILFVIYSAVLQVKLIVPKSQFYTTFVRWYLSCIDEELLAHTFTFFDKLQENPACWIFFKGKSSLLDIW